MIAAAERRSAAPRRGRNLYRGGARSRPRCALHADRRRGRSWAKASRCARQSPTRASGCASCARFATPIWCAKPRRSLRKAVAQLPSDRGFAGFGACLVEGCRVAQPLEPLMGSRLRRGQSAAAWVRSSRCRARWRSMAARCRSARRSDRRAGRSGEPADRSARTISQRVRTEHAWSPVTSGADLMAVQCWMLVASTSREAIILTGVRIGAPQSIRRAKEARSTTSSGPSWFSPNSVPVVPREAIDENCESLRHWCSITAMPMIACRCARIKRLIAERVRIQN